MENTDDPFAEFDEFIFTQEDEEKIMEKNWYYDWKDYE